MATLVTSNVVYSTVETGLMTQAPLVGEVDTVTGTPDLVVIAWSNGINQSFKSTDTAVNKLAVKATDPDASTILGKPFKTIGGLIGTVVDSWLVGIVRMVMLLVLRSDPRGPNVADQTTTQHWLITPFSNGEITS